MSNGMDQDWFAPEVTPAPESSATKAPATAPEAPQGALAPAAKTADEKSLEEKPEEWFSKPSSSTKNSEEEANEDWFEKAPEMKPKTAPKKNLSQEVENPPPMIPPPKVAPPKIAPPKDTQIPTKEEDSDNWFAKVPEKPTGTDSTVTMVKSQPRKEAYMYGYISKVIENIPNNTASNSNFSVVFKKVNSKVLDDQRMEDSSLPGPPAYKKEGGGGRAAAAMVIFK